MLRDEIVLIVNHIIVKDIARCIEIETKSNDGNRDRYKLTLLTQIELYTKKSNRLPCLERPLFYANERVQSSAIASKGSFSLSNNAF